MKHVPAKDTTKIFSMNFASVSLIISTPAQVPAFGLLLFTPISPSTSLAPFSLGPDHKQSANQFPGLVSWLPPVYKQPLVRLEVYIRFTKCPHGLTLIEEKTGVRGVSGTTKRRQSTTISCGKHCEMVIIDHVVSEA